jgi:GR25 family glycosyltransferase involved in LPS biosynthesis
MQTYCINLARNPERRVSAQTEFEREGLDVTFFRATDGKAEAPEGLLITKSEWGCADSHIRVWRDMVENGHEMALVFEDDISLVPNFNLKLREIMAELPEDWDYVNLDPNGFYTVDVRQFSSRLMKGLSLATSAYLIRHKCAKQWAEWDSTLMKVQVDSFITQCPVQYFHVRERLAWQDQKHTSEIGGLTTFRTMDWHVFMRRWGLIIAFLLFLFIVRRTIFE